MRVKWWVVLLIVVPMAASCRKVKKTTVTADEDEVAVVKAPAHYMGEQSCDTCHTWNLVAMHNVASPQYADDCIKCHGDMTNEVTLSEDVEGIHSRMCEYVYEAAGETSLTSAVCRYCHADTQRMQDYRGDSGGALRKQVNAELKCVECHTSAGPGREFYKN